MLSDQSLFTIVLIAAGAAGIIKLWLGYSWSYRLSRIVLQNNEK